MFCLAGLQTHGGGFFLISFFVILIFQDKRTKNKKIMWQLCSGLILSCVLVLQANGQQRAPPGVNPQQYQQNSPPPQQFQGGQQQQFQVSF